MTSLFALWNWLVDPTNLTAISTVVIAIFTVVLAVVAYVQARLLRKSIDLARAEFLSTHRPRIVVREVYLDGKEIRFRLVNVGDTPATIVESRLFAEVMQGKSGLRPLLTNGTNELGRLVIAPGEVRDQSYRPEDSLEFSFAAEMGNKARLRLRW